MRYLKSVFLIIALIISTGAEGQSPDAPASRINALSCETLPAPLEIEVRVLDDADRFIEFKELFEKELRSKSVKLSSAAAMTATLDIRTVREFQREPKDPLFEKRSGQDNSNVVQESTVFMRGNVWSNRDKSILGGQNVQPEKFSLNQLQVSASINRRTDGRCLWQGEVLHDLDGDEDPDTVTLKIIPVLAQALGKTIRNRPLKLNP